VLALTVFNRTPADVGELRVERQTTHTLDVAWDVAKKATGYEVTATPSGGEDVYAAAGKEAPAYPVETAEAAISLDGLIADEEYTITVRAFADTKGGKRIYQKADSAEVTGKTAVPILPILSTPALSADSPDTVSGVVEAAAPAEGSVVYEFFISSTQDGEYELIETLEPAFSKGELAEQTAYFVYAKLALDLDGKRFLGDPSEVVSVTTPAKPVVVQTVKKSSSSNSTPKKSVSSSWEGMPDSWGEHPAEREGGAIFAPPSTDPGWHKQVAE
jgi:hypothetical protein